MCHRIDTCNTYGANLQNTFEVLDSLEGFGAVCGGLRSGASVLSSTSTCSPFTLTSPLTASASGSDDTSGSDKGSTVSTTLTESVEISTSILYYFPSLCVKFPTFYPLTSENLLDLSYFSTNKIWEDKQNFIYPKKSWMNLQEPPHFKTWRINPLITAQTLSTD